MVHGQPAGPVGPVEALPPQLPGRRATGSDAQLLGQFPGRRRPVALAGAHTAAHQHVVVSGQDGGVCGAAVDEDASRRVGQHGGGDAVVQSEGACAAARPGTDRPVLGIHVVHLLVRPSVRRSPRQLPHVSRPFSRSPGGTATAVRLRRGRSRGPRAGPGPCGRADNTLHK